jgi:hypothetical protein
VGARRVPASFVCPGGTDGTALALSLGTMKTTATTPSVNSFAAALVSCRPSATTALQFVPVKCVPITVRAVPVEFAEDAGHAPTEGKVFWIGPCSAP